MRSVRSSSLALFAVLLPGCAGLTGCVAAGVTSGGHFFIFPGIGVLLLIFIVLLVMRRR
jgi:hypothetical protein